MENKQDLSNINWSDKSILIVEDDKFNAYIIENFLITTKINIKVAGTGELAVSLARSMSPDIILMDIKLPGINGLEAAQQIKKILPSVIIIAQTAFATENDKDEALKSGCNDFISKPIKARTLILTISKYL